MVAILVLVMGMSVSSVGSKSYMKELIEKFTGKSQVDVTNVKDMDSKNVEDAAEKDAYRKVDDMIKRKCVRIRNMPKGMKFVNYSINEEIQQADIFYEYKGETIRYEIYLNQTDSSKGVTKEDSEVNVYEIEVDGNKVKIEERKIEKISEKSLIAEFEYKGVYYQLKGIMEKSEFNKIIKNLKFY